MGTTESSIMTWGGQKYSTNFLAAEQRKNRKKKAQTMKLNRENYHVLCKRINRKSWALYQTSCLQPTTTTFGWLKQMRNDKELGFKKFKNPGRSWNEGSKHWQFLLEASISIKIQTARREYLKDPVQIWVCISTNKGSSSPEQKLPYKLHDITPKNNCI